MNNVKIYFGIIPGGGRLLNGYKNICYRMIFDVKMEDFRRKTRLVAIENMTKTPNCQTYSSVVSRETVCLALTIAVLNYFQVKSGDVMKACINIPITKKVWTVLGNEWGADAGKKSIIVSALYAR